VPVARRRQAGAHFRGTSCEWELPAIAASAYGLNATVLYRRPNLGAVADALINLRAGSMGTLVPTGIDAPFKLMRKPGG